MSVKTLPCMKYQSLAGSVRGSGFSCPTGGRHLFLAGTGTASVASKAYAVGVDTAALGLALSSTSRGSRPAGVYLARVTQGDRVATARFIQAR